MSNLFAHTQLKTLKKPNWLSYLDIQAYEWMKLSFPSRNTQTKLGSHAAVKYILCNTNHICAMDK